MRGSCDKEQTDVRRAAWIGLVVVAAAATSALASYLIYQKVLRPAQAREEAFAALEAGTLVCGPGGRTPLPAPWAIGSADGYVYVSGSAAGTLWALFPSRIGPGGEFRGSLYCNKPNKTAPKGTVDLESTPAGRPSTAVVRRALSPFGFDVTNAK
jgi:hypothetical protein